MLTETDGTLVLGFKEEVVEPFVGAVERGVVSAGVEASGAVLVGVEVTVDMPWGALRLLDATEAEVDASDGVEDCSTTDPPGVSGADDGSADVCEVHPARSARTTSAPAQRRA